MFRLHAQDDGAGGEREERGRKWMPNTVNRPCGVSHFRMENDVEAKFERWRGGWWGGEVVKAIPKARVSDWALSRRV